MTDVKFDRECRESAPATRACGRHSLLAVVRDDPLRPELERFVQTAFARAHGATVQSFMPTLLALRGQRRGICGVAGFRLASTGCLYLENYLDGPVEALLARHTDANVTRAEIAEVGNLAGSSCRAACHLVALLPHYLLERNQRWLVFTATRAVRALLERCHAPVFELGKAHRERVADAPDVWGRYYDTDPRVMAGFIPDGLRVPAFAHAWI